MTPLKMLSVSVALTFLTALPVIGNETKPSVNADMAQKMLLDGNKRYVESKVVHANQSAKRRTDVANGQNPFAVILSCSDSRVPPEILFDQGIGDLFVIRLAGNVVDDMALGSIEYAVEHLGCQYIMVLGHERCGAVAAAVKGGHTPGHIPAIVKAIAPAVDKSRYKPGDMAENAMRENVAQVVHELKTSFPILEERVQKRTLTVTGARYDLDDGTVAILP
jgi:carbonic anhydrase